MIFSAGDDPEAQPTDVVLSLYLGPGYDWYYSAAGWWVIYYRLFCVWILKSDNHGVTILL